MVRVNYDSAGGLDSVELSGAEIKGLRREEVRINVLVDSEIGRIPRELSLSLGVRRGGEYGKTSLFPEGTRSARDSTHIMIDLTPQARTRLAGGKPVYISIDNAWGIFLGKYDGRRRQI
ncbi:MAG: hypothetical protein AABW80_00835 [Nanoarchaeota archaeon]